MARMFHSENLNNLLPMIEKELKEVFKGCKTIAIKLHFGEPGNKYALTPEQVKPITDLFKKSRINYFLLSI